jgi:hypothetical protein
MGEPLPNHLKVGFLKTGRKKQGKGNQGCTSSHKRLRTPPPETVTDTSSSGYGHCFLMWKINLSYSESLEKLPDWVIECDG